MSERGGSSREQLAALLKTLRVRRGGSGRAFTAELKALGVKISQAKVSRVESGSALLTVDEAVIWANATGASESERERLKQLTSRAHLEASGLSWKDALADKQHLQDDIAAREAAATVIRTYQTSLVPGLLQIEGYARRVFSMFSPPYDDEALAAAVLARMERQEALHTTPQKFDFIVTEAALRWRPGAPSLLLTQLHHLAAIAKLDNVSFGLIPLDEQAVTTYSHGFVIYEAAAQSAVSLELIHGPLLLREESDVDSYRARWALLEQMALRGDAAQAFLGKLIASLTF